MSCGSSRIKEIKERAGRKGKPQRGMEEDKKRTGKGKVCKRKKRRKKERGKGKSKRRKGREGGW